MAEEVSLEVLLEKLKNGEKAFEHIEAELKEAVGQHELELQLCPIKKQMTSLDTRLKVIETDYLPKWVVRRLQVDVLIMSAEGTLILALIGIIVKILIGG